MSSSMIHPTTRRLDGPKTNHNSRSNQAAMDSIFGGGPAVNGYETEQVQELLELSETPPAPAMLEAPVEATEPAKSEEVTEKKE